jgi:hypothetical protein
LKFYDTLEHNQLTNIILEDLYKKSPLYIITDILKPKGLWNLEKLTKVEHTIKYLKENNWVNIKGGENYFPGVDIKLEITSEGIKEISGDKKETNSGNSKIEINAENIHFGDNYGNYKQNNAPNKGSTDESKTLLDKYIERLKNNKYVALLIVSIIALTSFFTLVNEGKETLEIVKPVDSLAKSFEIVQIDSSTKLNKLIQIDSSVKFNKVVQIDSSDFNEIVQLDSSLKINDDKDKTYELLLRYLSTRNGRNADAHQYFAENVDQYYLVYDVTPDRINILDQASIDYTDTKYTIKKETLKLVSKENNISYWRFKGNFSCYRPSLKKYQNGRIEMEYGINDEQKITRIILLDHKENYSIGKPF